MGNCGASERNDTSYSPDFSADKLLIEGPSANARLETYWMRQLFKVSEDDVLDFDFSGIPIWVKITSVDSNGIATAVSILGIGGTEQLRKFKVRFLDGSDATKRIGYIMRVRFHGISYSYIDAT